MFPCTDIMSVGYTDPRLDVRTKLVAAARVVGCKGSAKYGRTQQDTRLNFKLKLLLGEGSMLWSSIILWKVVTFENISY
jgi:hypothetical protein